MAETFDVFLIPPRQRWKEVVESLLNLLTNRGWKPDTMILRDPSGNSSDFLPASISAVRRAERAHIDFGKEQRWLSVEFGFNISGRVEIGSDVRFFQNANAVEEHRDLLHNAKLPAGTVAFGDIEQRIDKFPELPGLDELTAPSRFVSVGFFWLDQFKEAQWHILKEEYAVATSREVTRIGSTHVALMWDSPYDWLDSARKLEPIARRVAAADI